MGKEGRKYIRVTTPVKVLSLRSAATQYLMPGEIHRIIGVRPHIDTEELPCICIDEMDYTFIAKDITSFTLINERDLPYYFLLDYVSIIQICSIRNFFKDHEEELIRKTKPIIDA